MRKKIPIIIAIFVLVIFVVIAAFAFGSEDSSSIKEAETPEQKIQQPTETVAEDSVKPTEVLTHTPSATVVESIEVTLTPEPSSTTYIFDENNPDYREAMRQWVIKIATIARQKDSDFIVIPQNSAPLLTLSGNAFGDIASSFVLTIDAIGVEGISFGNNRYDKARKESEKIELVDILNVGRENGVFVLAVDYCDDENKVEEALDLNNQYQYLSYIADDMELTRIPKDVLNINTNDILSLDDAKNWLYLLNPERYSSKTRFINALSETDYDVLVLDAFFDTDVMLTDEDVAFLQTKSNGAKRIVIAYMSIGEAEDYRFYWKDEYDDNPPSWMLWENAEWEGNYPVEYWNSEWQEIIAIGEDSYLFRILDAGFDGVYLDIVDGYETFEDME